MSRHRTDAETRTCSPGCRYRALYEGTLASLADLNDKLRDAVGRHGRLRNNLVSVMKKAFPQQFLRAERLEQRRMADQSDEVLIRYLTLWLSQRPGSGIERVDGLEELRAALAAAGYVLPPDNELAGWARAVGEQQPRPPVDLQQPLDDGQAELVNIFDERIEPKVVDEGDPVGPGPVTDTHPSAAEDLTDLFADLEEAETAPEPAVAVATPAASPAAAGDSAQAAAGTAGDAPADGRRPAAGQRQAATLSQLAPARGGPVDDADSRAPAATPDTEPVAHATTSSPDTAPEATPDVTSTPDGSAPSTGSTDGVAAPSTGSAKTAPGQAMRPQLFPKTSSRKTRRRRTAATSSASAASPAPDVDVPQHGAGGEQADVPATLADHALEIVKRPTPVFTSDLVDLEVGTEAEIAAWEQACRDDRDSPVRFIPAKSRHRDRGALVIPYAYAKKAPAEFKRSVWAQALDRYRGGRLYEVAVLLHRVGSDLLSADLDDELVVLRLSQPRGTVAVVAVLGTDLERDGDDRARLVDAVESLLSSPLTLLAALVTNHPSLSDLVTALEEEARERDWTPPCPVIAQRSWDYAADRGSSATLVLGG